MIKNKDLIIEGKKIGESYPPFIIAEMSGNHNQSLDRALEIVTAAAKSGVQALKIQTYTADTMTIDINEREFNINSPNSLWKGQSLYKLYEKAHTPWEWHKPIFDLGRKLGLIVFSTPFDVTAVDYLEDLNTPCYKISSFENTDLPLIKKVASTRKPMFLSTGMASSDELNETVCTIRESGCNDFVLLKCTSAYPANPLQSNLLTIPDLKNRFGCVVGISDHTLSIGASIASLAIGGSVIEKHFTLRRDDGGVDSQFSIEPEEMAYLVK
jgi:pseudaminic acid synthase